MKYQTLFIALISSALGACSTINGVTGSSDKFGCKAPDGVSCNSVSGTYANAQANNLPSQRGTQSSAPSAKQPQQAEVVADYSASMPVVLPGVPIRSDQRTMRVWVAPWVDGDGDLHDQTYLYLVIDPGKWQIEHTKVSTAQQGALNSKFITSLKTGVRPKPTQQSTAPALNTGATK
jgi:conjugal transfer pilus assembly protein TraV